MKSPRLMRNGDKEPGDSASLTIWALATLSIPPFSNLVPADETRLERATAEKNRRFTGVLIAR